MKNLVLLTGAAIMLTISASAQNDIDAMRYSQITFGGTARFTSMGGSMGALGGDISTLGSNPAGIGLFRKAEFTITPSIGSQSTSSTYNNTNSQDKKLNLNLANIGLVTSFNLSDRNNTGWKSLNFGLNYSRTNSFQNRVSIQGNNKTSSLLDTYVAAANGTSSSSFDPFSTNLAWNTYLINPLSQTDSTHYNHVLKNYGELQQKSVESSGSMGETDLSFGGNYKNKVFVGATLGIVNALYNEQSVYQEVDEKDTINGFKSLSLSQNLTTRGTGVNFKFGMIVKATDWMRVGLAVHTPTVLHLSDSYNSSMKSDLDSGITYQATSPPGSFNYSITTPFRVLGSIGFVINKNALLNAEYEYVDYTNAQLNSSPNVFSDVNNTIRSKYTATGNIRVGGEIRFDPLAFRIGYAFYGSPFKDGENMNASRSSYTAGIGFRENNYFIDFAYVLTKYTAYDYLYDPTLVNSVKNDYTSSTFMLTCGVKFQ
jgi:hypothetical protein